MAAAQCAAERAKHTRWRGGAGGSAPPTQQIPPRERVKRSAPPSLRETEGLVLLRVLGWAMFFFPKESANKPGNEEEGVRRRLRITSLCESAMAR